MRSSAFRSYSAATAVSPRLSYRRIRPNRRCMDVLTGIEVETETAVWQRLMAQLSQLCGLLRIDLADLARIRG
jgi:hypothetical protein